MTSTWHVPAPFLSSLTRSSLSSFTSRLDRRSIAAARSTHHLPSAPRLGHRCYASTFRSATPLERSTAIKQSFRSRHQSSLSQVARTPRSPLLRQHSERPRTHASMATSMNSRPEGLERLADSLEKPLLDDRSYRVIKLANQLEALLIHDPDTDKASAAMDVDVGSLADPPEMQGMAHAVEHLLFMGTEKVQYRRDNRTECVNGRCADGMCCDSTLERTTTIPT